MYRIIGFATVEFTLRRRPPGHAFFLLHARRKKKISTARLSLRNFLSSKDNWGLRSLFFFCFFFFGWEGGGGEFGGLHPPLAGLCSQQIVQEVPFPEGLRIYTYAVARKKRLNKREICFIPNLTT